MLAAHWRAAASTLLVSSFFLMEHPMPKTPRKTRKARKLLHKTPRPRKPKNPPTPRPIGVLIVDNETLEPQTSPFTPATLDDIRLAYDAVNRGAAQVSISRSPHSPSTDYVLYIHPVPEFGPTPTPSPSPSPRPPTLEVSNHSNPKNIVFGPA